MLIIFYMRLPHSSWRVMGECHAWTEFAHTILIFIVSLSDQNMGLMKLKVWMQLFKFDFGFIDYLNIRNILYCKLGTERLIELHFYCQSTILNYLVLIIIILISILIVFVLKYASKYLKFTLMMYQFIMSKVTLENWVWIFIHIFWPFVLINLISDALNSSSHVIELLLSFALFTIWIIVLMAMVISVLYLFDYQK